MVAPRIGNWLSNPVNCPPSIGATSVTVAVTEPAITIRAGRSHLGGTAARRAGPAPVGQHHTIRPIPPSATSAPTTGGSATTWNATPNST
ncbi:MAG TPA: hypothetical protein VGJ45_19100 [Pseudonocardiaceae bacterium]